MFLGIDIAYSINVLPKLMAMLPITLFAVITAGVISFLLGLFITSVRIKRNKIIYQIISCYVSFTRSTPIMIQLFVVYYGIPMLFKLIGIDINKWNQLTFAIITLVLHNGAYISEVLRPAYLAVDKGQHDAADSIGMTGMQKLVRILGPQMIPIALPGLGNLLIDLIKDTSILFTIGVVDLMGRAKQIIANDYGIGKLHVFVTVAVIYWLISAVLEKFIHMLEKRQEKYKFAKGIKL